MSLLFLFLLVLTSSHNTIPTLANHRRLGKVTTSTTYKDAGATLTTIQTSDIRQPTVSWQDIQSDGGRILACSPTEIHLGGTLDKDDFAVGVVVTFQKTDYVHLECGEFPMRTKADQIDNLVFRKITAVAVRDEDVLIDTVFVNGASVIPRVSVRLRMPPSHHSVLSRYASLQNASVSPASLAVHQSAKKKPSKITYAHGFTVTFIDKSEFEFTDYTFDRRSLRLVANANFLTYLIFQVSITRKLSISTDFKPIFDRPLYGYKLPKLKSPDAPEVKVGPFLKLEAKASLDIEGKFLYEPYILLPFKVKFVISVKKPSITARRFPVAKVPTKPAASISLAVTLKLETVLRLYAVIWTGGFGAEIVVEAGVDLTSSVKATGRVQAPHFPAIVGSKNKDCQTCHRLELDGKFVIGDAKANAEAKVNVAWFEKSAKTEVDLWEKIFDAAIPTICKLPKSCEGDGPVRCEHVDGRKGKCVIPKDCPSSKDRVRLPCVTVPGATCCLPKKTTGEKVCKYKTFSGTCDRSTKCESKGKTSVPGKCPSALDDCCIEPPSCTSEDGRVGTCVIVGNCEKGSVMESGLCPKLPVDVKCCLAPTPSPTPCTVGGSTPGICIPRGQCLRDRQTSVGGVCAASGDVECCILSPRCTTTDGRSGKCLNDGRCPSSKVFVTGLCPGPADVKCCVPPTTSASASPSMKGSVTMAPTVSADASPTPLSSAVSSMAPSSVPSPGATTCTAAGKSGTCITTTSCATDGKTSVPGFCPGAADIQCCVTPPSCSTSDSRDGTCVNVGRCESPKTQLPGFCPSLPTDIQCCVDPLAAESPSPTPSPSSTGSVTPSPSKSQSGPTTCTAGGVSGTCITTSTCSADGKTSVPGFCPGAADIQCCITPPSCSSSDGRSGTCKNTARCESPNETLSGLCPSLPADVLCCVPPASCTAAGTNGVCVSTATCAAEKKTSLSGFCPGAADIQCCIDPPACTGTGGESGECINDGRCSPPKTQASGLCPSLPTEVRCCF